MKIKLDENLPQQLAISLKDLGHDVHTTLDEGLRGRSDREIWTNAQAESRFLITQDLDFSDIRQFAPGTHSGVLLVRLLSPSRKNLIACIGTLFRNENVEKWQGCFVVATERKIRVIRRESRPIVKARTAASSHFLHCWFVINWMLASRNLRLIFAPLPNS